MLSLIHISEPTRLGMISYAVFCLKKKNNDMSYSTNDPIFNCVAYIFFSFFFFLMIRRPPRSTQSRSSAASDVYKRQRPARAQLSDKLFGMLGDLRVEVVQQLSLIHISEPTRLGMISYAVFCLKKK